MASTRRLAMAAALVVVLKPGSNPTDNSEDRQFMRQHRNNYDALFRRCAAARRERREFYSRVAGARDIV